MKKVGLYVRLSQEDIDKNREEDDSRSIQNQKTMLLNYCVQQEWEVYNIYNDDDYTGSDRNRPAFKQLIEDAENKKFDIVLCKSQSRFTREMELVEKYIHTLFPIWGIRFIGLVDNADTNNIGNKKARQINGLVNEWYLEDMSTNIRSVFKTKCYNGKHIGSFACYGYEKDPNNQGDLIIDEHAAGIVREIFDMYDQGLGQIKICKTLNDRGVPNPTHYKVQKGLNYKSHGGVCKNIWTTPTIGIILKNQMYIGNMVQHKKENISYKSKKQKILDEHDWIIIENTHPPIIDKSQFERVQSRIATKQRSYKNGKMNKYARKLVCMYCGSGMYSNTWRNERYFRCRQKVVSKGCKGSLIKSSVLDATILEEFQKVAKEYLNKDEVEKKIQVENKLQERLNSVEAMILDFQSQLDKIKSAIKNLYLDKIKEVITEEDYIEFSQSFYEDRSRIETSLKAVEKQKEQLMNSKEDVVSKNELIEQFLECKEISYGFIEYFIDKIEIGKRMEKDEPIPVVIHWKF